MKTTAELIAEYLDENYTGLRYISYRVTDMFIECEVKYYGEDGDLQQSTLLGYLINLTNNEKRSRSRRSRMLQLWCNI